MITWLPGGLEIQWISDIAIRVYEFPSSQGSLIIIIAAARWEIFAEIPVLMAESAERANGMDCSAST
jgi:hypothetical protein